MLQYSVAVNNARLDAIETATGATALLKIYTGAAPANCAAAASGTLLATLTLPTDWMAAASAGVKAKAGTWTGTGSAAGVAGHCRIYDNAGTNCAIQGSAGIGSGDFQFDNTNIAIAQSILVSTFQITAANS